MPVVQQRNAEMVSLLSPDFQARAEPNFAWEHAVSAFLAIPGLRGFWPMSSVDEGGNCFDLSGQGRTLSYNGNPAYGISGLSPVLTLDGVGDYLNRADEAGLDILGTETIYAAAYRGLTVGGWFYPTAAADSGLISKWVAAGNQESYVLRKTAGNTCYFGITTDGSTVVAVNTTAITLNAWQFIVGRFDPSAELATFVNGVKATNVAGIPASIFNSNSALEIGRHNAANNYTGSLAWCFLSGMAVSDAVIGQAYEQTRALFGS